MLSIASAYPDKIRDCFPFPNLLDKGVVVVKFWSKQDKRWRLIFTDDQLPVQENKAETKWFGISPAGQFKNEFWINYLEKAMAYTIGNYPELEAGSKKIDIEMVYNWVLGPIDFHVTEIPSGETNKDMKKRAEVMQNMMDQFNGGCVLSLSSQHTKKFIDDQTGFKTNI